MLEAEYASPSKQLRTSSLAGSLLYRTRDQIHEAELLSGMVLKADNASFNTYFTINTPGTVFIWDNDIGKVVFGVRCTPITDGSEVVEFDKLSTTNLNFIHKSKHTVLKLWVLCGQWVGEQGMKHVCLLTPIITRQMDIK